MISDAWVERSRSEVEACAPRLYLARRAFEAGSAAFGRVSLGMRHPFIHAASANPEAGVADRAKTAQDRRERLEGGDGRSLQHVPSAPRQTRPARICTPGHYRAR